MTTPRVKLANDAVTTLEVVRKKACSTSNLKSDVQIKIKLTKVSFKQDRFQDLNFFNCLKVE